MSAGPHHVSVQEQSASRRYAVGALVACALTLISALPVQAQRAGAKTAPVTFRYTDAYLCRCAHCCNNRRQGWPQCMCCPPVPSDELFEETPELAVPSEDTEDLIPPTDDADIDGALAGEPSAAPSPQIPDLFTQGPAVASATTALPPIVGDFFGITNSISILSLVSTLEARGDIVSGGPADPFAVIAFEVGTDPVANDFFSDGGLGQDTIAPSPAPDTFSITEPVPPTDAPISPGPPFGFGGGVAVNPSGTFADGDTWFISYSYDAFVLVPSGLTVGRMKLAENESPIPRHRVFFNYSLFNNTSLIADGVTVNRFTPGFERTFHNDLMSLELRAPFASTLSSNIVVDSSNDLSKIEFGDLFIAYKALLMSRDDWALSAGLAVTVPTADDTNLFRADGTQLVSLVNESVHLGPFLGWAAVGRRDWFTQGFLQLDVDANGDSVFVNRSGDGLVLAGKQQDTTLLYIDVQVGRWLYRNDRRSRGVRGIAGTVEVHFNRSLQSTDVVAVDNFRIGQAKRDVQILSVVPGATFDLGPSAVTLGYATQVGNGSDRQFDGELRVIWNRYF